MTFQSVFMLATVQPKSCAREVSSRLGGRLPASCTGLGKAMLAYGGHDALERICAAGLTKRTDNSIVDLDAFNLELAEVRRCGAAFDREEAEPGIVCVAAPIRGSGRAVAALSVTGPANRVDIARIKPAVTGAAAGIWQALFPPRVDALLPPA